MKTLEILKDWEDYDSRKMKEIDKLYFSCSDPWEIDYLIKKIQDADPSIGKEKILRAVHASCKSIPSPRPRGMFIKSVVTKLNNS